MKEIMNISNLSRFRAALLSIYAVILCFTAISCGGGNRIKNTTPSQETPTAQYNTNFAKWRSVAPRKYKLQVSSGNVFNSYLLTATVIDGQITDSSVVDQQGTVDDATAMIFINSSGTIDRLFTKAKSTIDDSSSSGVTETEPLIVYDTQYGFPSVIRSPSSPPGVVDGGGGVSVYKFEVIP